MKLQVGDVVVKAHFRYSLDAQRRPVTRVNLHSGSCEGRPCEKGLTGLAACSHLDCFVKAVGRKLALQRALRMLPRADRGPIWAAYFAVSKPPKGRPACSS